MAYIYRTRYVPDYTSNSKVETVHFYQEKINKSKEKKVPTGTDPFSIKGMIENSKPFDFDGYRLEECWDFVADEFTELLKQSPEVIEDEIIKRRLQNTYKYAQKRGLNPNNCFQYSKSAFVCKSDLLDVDHVLIQIRSPFDQFYLPITIVEQGPIELGEHYFFITGQSQIDAVYNRNKQELILQNSNHIYFVPEKEQYNCYHYMPESMGMVKKLNL